MALTVGKNTTIAQKAAMATAKGYDTGKKSTGSKPSPKPKVSMKGTNPLSGKASITIKKKF